MVVPVVQVRPVDVLVCHRSVIVGVSMRRGHGNIGMFVVVVIIIVMVPVLMIHRNMPVDVTVFLAQ